MPLRLIFMGTPDFAVPTLLELVAHGYEVVAVYTRAPKPGGRRGLQLQPTPVEQEARRLGIPVLTPKTLKTQEALDEFSAFEADAAVVVAYGMILPQAIRIVIPPLTNNCINVMKDTALASVVAMPDLLKQATQAQALSANPTPLIGAALIYIALLWPMVAVVARLEKHYSRGRR